MGEAEPNRARLYVAGVLVAGLVVAGLVVILAGSSEEAPAAADDACIEDWNSDPSMISLGRHQFGGHGYERVEVLRIDRSAEPTESGEGRCAVVFAARALDPEPGARAQVLRGDTWQGIEALRGVSEERIARLQADAFAAVNAALLPEGRLVAKPPG